MCKTNINNLFATSVFLLVLVFFLTIVSTAPARNITVDDDGPADFDNIQSAIDDSNDSDIIIVHPGTYTGAGNRDISFNDKAITVRSEDPNDPNIVAATIIDCNGTEEEPHRGFFFNAGEEADSILAGLTITNGYADNGGGICCEASRPTITSCIVSGNTAQYEGGGIYFRDCSMPWPHLPGRATDPNPPDGSMASTTAILSWKAGAYATSHDVYFGTSKPPPFVGNQTSTTFDPGTMAGGTKYYWRINELNINGKTTGYLWDFLTILGPPPPPPGSHSEQPSPEVLSEGHLLGPTITDCILSDNTALGGGGMFVENSTPILVNCIFSKNLASSGGGICITDSNTTLADCVFSGNSAMNIGGGMCNWGDSNTTLTNCIFNDNSTTYSGGGIHNDESSHTILTNCTFTGNSVSYVGIMWGDGGGICNYSCNSTLTNCTFNKNSANWGGGIFNIWDSNISLNECIFSENSASRGGGGLYNTEDSNTMLTECIFIKNSAGGGGGLSNVLNRKMTLINCIFSENSADTGGGMGNFISYSTLTNCVFSGNLSEEKGGGMYNIKSSPTLKNCTFSANVAEYTGGPIIIPPWPPQPPPVYGIGGAMYNEYSSAELINCTFTGNRAHEEGGAIFWRYPGPPASPPPPPPPSVPHFTESSIKIGTPIESLSITDFNDSNIPMISNCIFWDNRDSNGTDELSQIRLDPNETPVIINYSCIQGWTGVFDGTDNIYDDPCFVQPGYWNVFGYFQQYSWYEGCYQLRLESPCIDAGDPNYLDEPNEMDLNGRSRIVGGRIDMGAYEYQGPGQELMFYVDDDATGANDGSSWADAFNYLQDALAAAQYGDQIFVAQGIYKPDRGHRVMLGDREATFRLKSGVAIIGGYAGANAPDPNARNIGLYETILSGDLDGNDVEVLDPCNPWYEPTRMDNALFVVTSSMTNATAVLDGFTITSAYSSGMYNQYSSVTIKNCTFTNNVTSNALYWFGAAMCNSNSSPTATNCNFLFNSGKYEGGGMYNGASNPILINCVFIGNSAQYYGGGMSNDASSPLLVNCIFIENVSGSNGGGIFNILSNPMLTNCTLTNNWAGSFGGGIYNKRSEANLINCILWGNTNPEEQGQAAQIYGSYHPVINYCCIEGWTGDLGGSGNIGTDPCFVEQGCWDVNGVWIEGDYHLLLGSPCIDAGDPDYILEPDETDLDGNPRVIGGRIDMGAYEYFSPRPFAEAGPDQVVECACNTQEGTKVTLDGTGSYDEGDNPLTFTWTGPFVESPANGATPTVTLESGCPGEYVITLVVNNGIEDSEPNDVVITVVDTTPPEFALTVTPSVLWPPNHKMVEITPSWTVSDECDASPDVSLVNIVMSEGDDTIGVGHTSDDIQIGEDGSIYLRSERSGTSSDRVYTITCQAVDDSGNTTVCSATVSIPHDFKVLAGIASRWLWIKQAGRIPEDLNSDGVVNFTDFAKFAENWIR